MMNTEQHTPAPSAAPDESFQARVKPWMMACFGAEISADGAERNHRFLEESLELVQACGCTASEAHQLVDYVYGRPVGERAQEVGGVMVTLGALCLAQGLDMHAAGEIELARIWTKVEAIRAKQAAKPKHSPLPAAAPQVAADERTAFEVWTKAEGLIQESHGILSTSSMCAVALKAWKAGRAALAAAPVRAVMTLDQIMDEAAKHKRALVPLHVTRAMQEIMDDEGWQWADVLGAAEAVTDQQYAEIQAGPAAPVQAREPTAVVYPPDGTVSPFTVINLGQGLVKMGDSLHDGRLPALWFGTDGLGMGVAEEMNRAAKPGETLAVVTFANVEGLDVLSEVVQRIRSVAFPSAPVQPVAVPDGDALVNAMCKAGLANDHGRRTLLNGEEIGFDLLSLMAIVRIASPAAQGDAKDAERYRWLRHGDNDEAVLQRGPVDPSYVYLPRNEKLDATIDAAIAAKAAS